jgi:hypothetical protein
VTALASSVTRKNSPSQQATPRRLAMARPRMPVRLKAKRMVAV